MCIGLVECSSAGAESGDGGSTSSSSGSPLTGFAPLSEFTVVGGSGS